MPFRFRTAGESHGRGLVCIIEGIPAGLPLSARRDIDPELRRRQGGYGRGARMKIEQDAAEPIAGIRFGETIGAPLAFIVWNRDWQNWQVAMSADPPDPAAEDAHLRRVHLPRPGHADLVGVLKYDRSDARDILERASARETTARVAAASVARRLLEELGVHIHSHVLAVGEVRANPPDQPDWQRVEASPVHCADPEAEARMIARIDEIKEGLDTIGGVFEVRATGVPIGLGSFVQWDRKLDGRLAQAVMSMQAVKGVEIGGGFTTASLPGSQVQDILLPREQWTDRPWTHATNRAGGLEGGVTNGEDVIVRGALKPISTLPRGLPTVDLRTAEPTPAFYERSDVCVVPAAGVIGEAMVAIILADAVLEKFGGDHLQETLRNYQAYMKTIGPRGEM